MKAAEVAARSQVQTIAARFEKTGWRESVGSSGTARSLAEILAENGAMLRVFHDAGFELTEQRNYGVVSLTMELKTPVEAIVAAGKLGIRP